MRVDGDDLRVNTSTAVDGSKKVNLFLALTVTLDYFAVGIDVRLPAFGTIESALSGSQENVNN